MVRVVGSDRTIGAPAPAGHMGGVGLLFERYSMGDPSEIPARLVGFAERQDRRGARTSARDPSSGRSWSAFSSKICPNFPPDLVHGGEGRDRLARGRSVDSTRPSLMQRAASATW